MVTTRLFTSPGQLLTETYSGGPLDGLGIINGYDEFLRRTNFATPSDAIIYSYDEANRLRSVSIGSSSMTYDYFANSPLVENIWFTNSGTRVLVVTNFHDKLNRLTNKVWGGSSGVLASYAYQYNSAHQRTRMDMAGSSYSSLTYWLYEYDSLGQVISAKRYWSDGSVVAGQQNLYNFDDIGNREYAAWGGDQWGANLRYENYTANVLNQITQRTVPPYVQTLGEAATNATVTVNNVWTTRKGTYWRGEVPIDNSSAAQWLTLTNLSVIQQPGTNLDLVTNIIGTLAVPQTPQSFSYDADGNLTNDGQWIYTWDAENHLMQMETVSGTPTAFKRLLNFAYDHQGRRIQKIVSTNDGSNWVGQYTNRFLYDGWNLVAILNEQSTMLHSFIWGTDLSGTMRGAGGVGGLLAWVIHTGTYAGTYFYTQDGNGNITRVVRASDGSVMAEYEYDPFGRLLRATGPLAMINPFRFSSKYMDDETGLVYYGYRYYNPATGTWLSGDPIEEGDGPNLYAFVRNNPVSIVDIDGRTGWGINYGNYGGSSQSSTYRTPIRPDHRDRPQRRPERRGVPPRNSHGDPKCASCGPDVTAGLEATMSAVKTRFDALTDEQKEQKCSLGHLFGTWDIIYPTPPKGCGEGPCYDTVMVRGRCYDKWKVNYLLFGRISSLCDFWRLKMEGLVAGQKLIRKPLVDGDTENEYTGDVTGFMRIGYNWSGKLPSTLPGPTGGFSGCGPCKAAGANDPKYSSAFSTTWP